MFWAPVFFTLASVLSLFFYHLDIGFEVAGRQEHIPVMPININPSLYGVPGATPIWKRGEEPLPPGLTEEDRPMFEEQQKWGRYAGMAMESCAVKTVLAGGAGFGIGAFFSLMSASFAYEDPYLRTQGQTQAQLKATQKASAIFKEMGKGMVTSGKGFAKVGALFAGIECVIESYRAKNDIYNSVGAGFLAGGILARNAGPKAVVGGGLAFAAFSAAIDMFIRREPSDDD